MPAGDRQRAPLRDGAELTRARGAHNNTNSYGSRRLRRASQCARALRFELRSLGPIGLTQTLLRVPSLALFLLRVPCLDVHLSASEPGRMLAAQLSLRRLGIPRYRLAQGVLALPPSITDYLRGRSRQAVRTNIRRALEQGIVCHYMPLTVAAQTALPGAVTLTLARPGDRCEIAGDWVAANAIEVTGTPGECWWACDATGTIVGHAWLTVDERCAVLHALGSSRPGVRWLLHSAIVERLCASRCEVLLTNSFDAPLMEPGAQYFQALLGYTIARVRLHRPHPRHTSAALEPFAEHGLTPAP